MRRHVPLVRAAIGILSVTALVNLVTPVAVAQGQSLQVVASGLDNPRGLAFGPEGALYVAEAGRGGSGVCIPSPEAGAPPRCYGASGAITRIWRGTVERIATGFPSLAPANGSGAGGPTDISFLGRGGAYVMVGLGGEPAEVRESLGAVGPLFGRLYHLPASGKWQAADDVAAHEFSNPDGGAIDSNPYAVLALPSRRVVADAGANALVEVAANGVTSTLAVFPSQMVPAPPFLGLPPGTRIPSQAVPTSAAIGPDGAFYVGQLTGFPFPVGGASVWRVPAQGGPPEVHESGFTNIIDVAFGHDGSLYVLEFAQAGLLAGPPAGKLTRIAPGGVRSVVVGAGLIAPGGVAIAPDGGIYLTNFGTSAGGGQVVKVLP